MPKHILAMAGVLFCLKAVAAPELKLYTEAKGLESIEPERACAIYQKLLKKDFVLKDLAFLRQALVCQNPILDGAPHLSEKPWLLRLDLQRQLKEAERKKDLESATGLRLQLGRAEKSQKLILASLKATEDFVEQSDSLEELKQKCKLLITKAREEVAPRFIKNPSNEQLLKVAQDLSSNREFQKARQVAEQILKNPKSPLDQQISARKIRRMSFKVEQNTSAFLKTIKEDWRWTDKKNIPAKNYELGLFYAKALWTEGQIAEAKKILSGLEKKYRKTLHMNELALIRGKMAEEQKDWEGALEAYGSTASPLDLKSNNDKKIQFAKAWDSWKLGEFPQMALALDPLIALGKDDPFESARGLFWKSRALGRLGKKEEAQSLLHQLQQQDPLGFYGALAYYELNEKFPALKVPKLPRDFQKSPLYDDIYFQALSDANEIEILQLATAHVLESVRPEEPVENWLPLFLAAAKANTYLPLFSQISTLTPENRSTLLEKDPQLIFPMDNQELILKSAKKFNVPAELIFSIIRQESAFNPFARSPADAFGLMQILPSVSKVYLSEVKIPVEHFEDLFLPDVNIPYGTVLLRDLLKKHNGKIFLAAAAYNANEKALKNWLTVRWNNDPVEFIEEIPYEETRAYVKLIVRNYAFYSRLLHSGEAMAFPKACLGD